MKLDGTTIFDKQYITQNKNRWLNYVRFPTPLELDYQKKYRKAATYEFRYRAPIILILYLFLCVGIGQVLPDEQIGNWIAYYGWVGVVIIIAWCLSFSKRLEEYFDVYVIIGSVLAIAITFILITTTPNGQNNVLFHAAMMYAVLITYTFVGLRFYTISIAGWFGGLFAILITLFFKDAIEWTFLNRTYTFSSILGMAVAYATDRQHRESYIQNCIIALNNLELTVQAEHLAVLSREDALTGLANRRYLDEVLHLEWNRAFRTHNLICIMMIDIDFFKRYNDSLGHIAGDKCLKKIATIISSMACRAGELAARYGGEEFFLLFPSTDEKQAQILVDRLITSVRDSHIPHPDSDISDHVTITVGIAVTVPSEKNSINELLTEADNALYIAKINGRNQYKMIVKKENV